MTKPDMAAGLGKVLQEALSKKNQKSSLPEDFNTLVLPDKQEITDNGIVWTWIVSQDSVGDPGDDDDEFLEEPDYEFLIVSQLITKGNRKGDYDIKLLETPTVPRKGIEVMFHREESKNVGRALISAWIYQHVWKDHAGHFLEKELMDD